ncbi:PhzF family phenazine biosynthesis protein [Actinocrispum wychmicini]|uniref:PhzF family phenazine biosynthesis protein n=1 Tax=Actinocrispum wychmicini TaxID=1213861 RepID=A0A4V6NNT2_9PSEU|nr:PhzF family phenazine biosynthesis protein [Actinocrispum wychmicini]TCO54720.1 PhzF family phenazine biosynthesis protein [Actinocrispum wychmicini]
MHYHHVDVFTPRPYRGNSLAVFPDATRLDGAQMGVITRELRHFESIFLTPDGDDHRWRARVFDLVEELGFAGHPVIGAACVVHELHGGSAQERWTIQLEARTVQVTTERRTQGRYSAVLDQGPADFLGQPARTRAEVASWFSVDERDVDAALPLEVVSTGLRYLIVPVRSGALDRARIAVTDLATRLGAMGADFAYLVDVAALEGRHWNNDGVVEDVATGSAAGCVAAYLRRHERLDEGTTAVLRQGRFLGRPSEITIRAYGTGTSVPSVEVGGDVVLVGTGTLDLLPE